jgi:hypothetical protein
LPPRGARGFFIEDAMAFTPKVIDGGGKPEPDARIIEALEAALAKAKAGEAEGVFILMDGEDHEIWCAGNALVLGCLAEIYAQEIKAAALGFGDE